MGGETVGAQVTSSSRMRKGELAPKRRPGVGAQPEYHNRKSHQPHSFRHTVEQPGRAQAVPPLTTRKRS